MRHWGLVITGFYSLVVLLLLFPAWAMLAVDGAPTSQGFLEIYQLILNVHEWYWGAWLYAGILLGGQALLLFLSVDTSWRHAKPRQHLAVTITLASSFAAILTFAAIWSLALGIGVEGKGFLFALSPFNGTETAVILKIAAWWGCLWTIWGVIFYLYLRDSVEPVTHVVSWLLKGSVLELLIAVPAHVAVRYRNECSAPAVTSWGIVTGLAVMLLCFGPGVLALYRRKLDSYSRNRIGSKKMPP